MSNIPLAALAQRARSGDPLFLGWCGSFDPFVPEAMLNGGFETVLLDMQHGTLDFHAAARGVAHLAARGRPAFVRIPVGEFATASKLLDAGAAAIVAPMINSVADAEALVGFCKFPPVGERSWGPGRALAWSGLDPAAYFKAANDLHIALAMIETKRARWRRSTTFWRCPASTASSSARLIFRSASPRARSSMQVTRAWTRRSTRSPPPAASTARSRAPSA